MAKVLGIIISEGSRIRVKGLKDYRPIGAFSFLGRYRVVDFPLSNMSNSGIDRIHVYAGKNPRSLVEHVGGGRHYNINSKRGGLQVLFSEAGKFNDVYDTDIQALYENRSVLMKSTREYVVLAPSYMVYAQDYSKVIKEHIASGADITMLYHQVNTAKEDFLSSKIVDLGEDVTFDGYSFVTANDAIGRDPRSWTLSTGTEKGDSIAWSNVGSETGFNAPSARFADAGKIFPLVRKDVLPAKYPVTIGGRGRLVLVGASETLENCSGEGLIVLENATVDIAPQSSFTGSVSGGAVNWRK